MLDRGGTEGRAVVVLLIYIVWGSWWRWIRRWHPPTAPPVRRVIDVTNVLLNIGYIRPPIWG